MLYRVWIGRVGRWRPGNWRDVPPRFLALELADEGIYPAPQALAYLQGFNTRTLGDQGTHWAIAAALGSELDRLLAPRRLISGRQIRRGGPWCFDSQGQMRHAPRVACSTLKFVRCAERSG